MQEWPKRTGKVESQESQVQDLIVDAVSDIFISLRKVHPTSYLQLSSEDFTAVDSQLGEFTLTTNSEEFGVVHKTLEQLIDTWNSENQGMGDRVFVPVKLRLQTEEELKQIVISTTTLKTKMS